MESKLATSIKITNALTFNPAISLLEAYPTDMFARLRNGVFKITGLGIGLMTKNWQQPKYVTMWDQLNTLCTLIKWTTWGSKKRMKKLERQGSSLDTLFIEKGKVINK